MEIKRRLFIAILLPEKVKSSLAEIIQKLSVDFPELRYEKKEKLHLTLKFLGWTNISCEKISESLQKVVSKVDPFDLTFDGIDFFFSASFILFANLQESKPLLDLVQNIEDEMKRIGFPKERRPFRNHITLARGKRKPLNYWKELAQKISQKHFSLPPSFTVKDIVLMESILNKEGSEYKKLKSYQLK